MKLLCQECAQFSFTNTYKFPSKRVQWVYNCHFSQLHHSLIFYCFNAPFNYWLCYSLSFINVLFVNLDCFFYRGFSFPYIHRNSICFNDSVQFSRSVVSDSFRPHELQHARPPCPSPTPRVHLNSHASSQWCHPAISSSVIPFSSCPQSLPASGSFPMSQLFAWGGQSTGVSASASFLPMNTQDWSPLEWTGWISLQSKGLSGVFSNTTVRKH